MGLFGPRLPCRATIVTPPSIHLEDLDRAARETIAQQGLKIERDAFGSESVLYEDDGPAL